MTALYQAHAAGLVRLAMLMLGDQSLAEDVVQDAFLGLYRRWDSLRDHALAVELRPLERAQRLPRRVAQAVPPHPAWPAGT